MCPQCDGLGETYSFAAERLVPNADLSFAQGAIELVGAWRDMGRWRRHIYQGVADTVERLQGLDHGTMLETPWRKLPPDLQKLWLHGTGEEHITFTWRNGPQGMKYGGHFEGIIPQLLSRHRSTNSKMQQRQLEKYMSVIRCATCQGARLNPQARSVTISTAHPKFAERPARSLPEVCALAVSDAGDFFSELVLDATGRKIAEEAVKEIRGRLGFLVNVGLDYLALDRTAPTLSGGETQRIRLAGQIGCGLVGVLYILDEPSIGLHPRDTDRLIHILKGLRDLGNTLVVVEHDPEMMKAADRILDLGPGAGEHGGRLIFSGTLPEMLAHPPSLTGRYLRGELTIPVPQQRRKPSGKFLKISGARSHNLKGVDVAIPLNLLVAVTGVSGSGKSTLIYDVLYQGIQAKRTGRAWSELADRIDGDHAIEAIEMVDQSPIGRTPRSNPATYLKAFDTIREIFAATPEAKKRGFGAGHFSFNIPGGRCEACQGDGTVTVEMRFLADVELVCEECHGTRFKQSVLDVKYKEKNIHDVLQMTVREALAFFASHPKTTARLRVLDEVGLGYLRLGQSGTTLSGGEAQRLKLAAHLTRQETTGILYIFDEPTTGLHFDDIQKLLAAFRKLIENGASVIIIEHNLDVIKASDWVIDLGPEGGDAGGRVIAAGTPEQVARNSQSYTGQYLARTLDERNALSRN
jgi:excinuclease ABC subunit A